jgi:hypothetical protein
MRRTFMARGNKVRVRKNLCQTRAGLYGTIAATGMKSVQI